MLNNSNINDKNVNNKEKLCVPIVTEETENYNDNECLFWGEAQEYDIFSARSERFFLRQIARLSKTAAGSDRFLWIRRQ